MNERFPARYAAASVALALLLPCSSYTVAAKTAARPLLVTVDDLPIAARGLHHEPSDRERVTRDLLAVLAQHDVRAVAFVVWSNVTDETDRRLLEMWLDAGHELGNHSYGHLDFTRTPIEAYLADLELGRVGLDAFLRDRDRTLRFFRFPMLREGETSAKLAAVRDYLAETGQRNLPVTIDTQDWSFEAPWLKAAGRRDEPALRVVGEDYQAALRLSVRDQERTGDRLFDRQLPQVLLLHANAVGASNKYGIVFSPSVTVKSAPDEDGTKIFVIHEGTKINVLENFGDWSEIALMNGTKGWVKTDVYRGI